MNAGRRPETRRIVVDGANGGEPKAPLEAGASPASNSHKKKIAVGETGEGGRSNREWPDPKSDAQDFPGGAGWHGDEHTDLMNGEEGEDGAPGGNGGHIRISCGRLEAPCPRPSARGGQGGQGQQGQAGAKGGRGGKGADTRENWGWYAATAGGPGGRGGKGGKGGTGGRGGNGGTIEILTMNPFVIGDSYDGERWIFVKAIFYGDGGDRGLGGAPGPEGEPGEGGAPNEYCVRHLVNAYGSRPLFLGPLNDDATYKANYQAVKYGGARGEPGKPGSRGDPGGDGDHGALGGWKPNQKGTFANLASFANLSHLQLCLEALRIEAAVSLEKPADLASDNPAATLLTDRLSWLVGLLQEIAKGLGDDNPDKLRAAWMLSAAYDIASNVALGRNAFGDLPTFVPVVSLDSRHGELLNAIKNLSAVEGPANAYLANVAAAEDARANLALAHVQTDAIAGYLDTELTTAKADLDKITARLDQAEVARKSSREALEPLLRDVAKQVREVFTVDPAVFLNALSQLAFMEVHSAPKAAAMMIGQGGSVIADATSSILSDSGEKFDKRYLLHEIKSFDADRMGAELTANAQGFKDDGTSYRDLTDLARFRQRIADFVDNPQLHAALELKAALTAQIDAIDRRNRLVDEYNDGVRRILDLRAAAKTMRDEKRKLNSEGSALADPSEPTVAAYVTGLLDRAKWEALRQLHLFHRAYVLWALDPDASLAARVGVARKAGDADALASSFATVSITAATITAAKGAIEKAISHALEHTRQTPTAFPSSPKPFTGPDGRQWLAPGVLVVLDPWRHPQIFNDFEDYDEATFELLPATRKALGPGRVDVPVGSVEPPVEPLRLAIGLPLMHVIAPVEAAVMEALAPVEAALMHSAPSREANPFIDKANVRLTKVRVFLDEEGAKGLRRIHLVHTGEERFARQQGDLFPADGYVIPRACRSVVLEQQRRFQVRPEARVCGRGAPRSWHRGRRPPAREAEPGFALRYHLRHDWPVRPLAIGGPDRKEPQPWPQLEECEAGLHRLPRLAPELPVRRRGDLNSSQISHAFSPIRRVGKRCWHQRAKPLIGPR